MSTNEKHGSKRRMTFAWRYRSEPGSRAEMETVYRELGAFIRRMLGSEATSGRGTETVDFKRAKGERKDRKRRAS